MHGEALRRLDAQARQAWLEFRSVKYGRRWLAKSCKRPGHHRRSVPRQDPQREKLPHAPHTTTAPRHTIRKLPPSPT